MEVDNWRWAGTPFYLRTGKRLPRRATEVAIQFKPAPHLPFASTAVETLEPNLLLLRIQPDEGASLRFLAKVPGPQIDLRVVSMDFAYGSAFLRSSPGGLRAPPARRPARRLDAVHALGRGGAGVGDLRPADPALGDATRPTRTTTRPGPGGRTRPTP